MMIILVTGVTACFSRLCEARSNLAHWAFNILACAEFRFRALFAKQI